ncbi:MAG: hypothetical protein WCI39_10915 [Gallionellaceae bacterium]
MNKIFTSAAICAATLLVTACGDSDIAKLKAASCEYMKNPMDMAAMTKYQAVSMEIGTKHAGDLDWAAKAAKEIGVPGTNCK